MSYEYKTVELPANIAGSASGKGEAARTLQAVIDQHAVDGFEFYRVDSFTVSRPQGCLLGGQQQITAYNVVTFRRPKR